MATRKTAAGTETKTLPDVSNKKTVTAQTTAPLRTKRTRVKKKDTAPKATLTETLVPNKADIHPIDDVMKIKEHNEEVKSAKEQKKAEKKALKTAKAQSGRKSVSTEAEEKGARTLADTQKRRNVITKAQKAAAEKFAAQKAKGENENACCCSSFCHGAFGAWADAYKNIFNFRGRTSRYEFWSFMLINFFVITAFMGGMAIASDGASDKMALLMMGLTAIFYVVEMLVALSIAVRRLHDTGNTAWKGFFAPMVVTLALGIGLMFAAEYYLPDESELYMMTEMSDLLPSLLTALALVVLAVIYLYYAVKTFITVCFIEEDCAVLESGEPRYTDAVYKKRAVKYASIYYIVMFFLTLFSIAFIRLYMMAVALYGTRM